MTSKNIFKFMAASVLVLGIQSCNDFLDKLPDDRTELDSVDKAQKLLINAYPSVNYNWIGEISSDNLMDNQTPHLPSNPNKKQIKTYYNYSPYDRFDDELYRFDAATLATYGDYDSPGQLWEGHYSSIASCNYVLQTLETYDDGSDKVKALRAEALLIRAYNHFCLVNIFSQAFMGDAENQKNIGIPYVTEPETTMTKEYDRGTVAETYANIKKDLESALPYISDQYMESPKYHFNIQAAHAFAARFYLHTHNWEKVIEHANEVLGTDSASVEKVMMDWRGFDDCGYLSDYSTIWQDPDQASNLMILATNSLLERRVFGTRYSLAGEKCQEAMMVRTTNTIWSGYICPVQAVVGGMLFGSSTHDYGFFSAKIGEEFQYSNKLAGIGYPHIMVRAFTTASLLLERAEAKLMLGDLKGASEDLCLYWNSPYKHFSEESKETYSKYYTMLTDSKILKSYTQSLGTTTDKMGQVVTKKLISNANCYLPEEWVSFAGNVQNTYSVSAEAAPYMNCLNEFRRFENVFEGTRFLDLKRWGIPYNHHQGSEDLVYEMKGNDTKRAIEVPWETMAEGLSSSRTYEAESRTFTMNKESLKIAAE